MQIGFAFWYPLTWVVPEKGPLNECVCACVKLKCNFKIAQLLLKLQLKLSVGLLFSGNAVMLFYSYVVDELKARRSVAPQMYPTATIYFSDIVGFTVLSSASSPIQIIELLNDLYNTFDDTISRYDVYKVYAS